MDSVLIIAFATLGLTLLTMLILLERPWRGFFIAVAITIAGWILVKQLVDADIAATDREIQRIVKRGERIPAKWQQYDPDGDRIFSTMLGWFPGGLGTLAGGFIAFVIRYARSRRLHRIQVQRGFEVANVSGKAKSVYSAFNDQDRGERKH